MSAGLMFEINLLVRQYHEKFGEEPKYVILSGDQLDTIRKMRDTYFQYYTLNGDQETFVGLDVAIVKGKSIMKVAG